MTKCGFDNKQRKYDYNMLWIIKKNQAKIERKNEGYCPYFTSEESYFIIKMYELRSKNLAQDLTRRYK